MIEFLIAGIVGLLVGVVIGFLVANGKKQALVTQVEVLKAAKEEQAKQALAAKQDVERHYQTLLAEKDKSCREALAAQEKRHQEAIQAQQVRFDEIMAKVSAQVRSATDDMLKQRQREFAESSHTNLGQILNPLRETIDKMKQTMADSTLKQTAMGGEMKVTIEQMMRQSEAARKSAEELARVFKHGSKVQGDWGETVLDELLTSQGLKQGIHYDVQSSIPRREVIIDSKVSLTAFMDYVNAETEEERARALKAHVESIKAHVKELSAKDYSSYIQPPKVKMDYVIMFVPHTGALWTALNVQPDLWRRAMERNVFIADEQTLFAALRIISLTWTQISQIQNHKQIYDLANEMLERVGAFMKQYQALGDALDKAQKAYDGGTKKLQPSGQSILQTCKKLQTLGAKQSNRYPIPQLEDIDEVPPLEMAQTDEKA